MNSPGRFFNRRVGLLTRSFLLALCLSLSVSLAFGVELG
jgi:hypothetical protein